MVDSPPGFGDPQSIAALATGGQETIATLDKLTDLVNRDVAATVPAEWGGDAAGAMGRFWGRYLSCMGTHRSPTGVWCGAIGMAAGTMAKAREQLANAQQFADRNDLFIGRDLVVLARDPSRPGAAALVAAGQQAVNAAVAAARLSQEQIRAANEAYSQALAENHAVLETLIGILGRRGGGKVNATKGGRRPSRQTTYERAYEGKVRVPAANKGTWVKGDPNDGIWRPHRPGEYGLQWPNDTIRWREGVPNLRSHGVPVDRMPDGRAPVLDNLRGLNGKYANDYRIADEHLASRFGWGPEQVARWRKENDYVWHHYSASEMQLVPGRVHRGLAHEGGASDLR